ncbi:hypothetical protein [Marinifilum caeruleilacunae]|uniref:DUF5017 domain-containing protein n=1 Tax=Marinifilum caeruleilacunae TaxID=2499076 RepID=A0ABX1X084_9BACT|nr:hypothetical protein [Marinifilum caeruleilacunae]NOU61682.1 hypothetical protein [Marinifilum caeruleilacunae]
MKKLLYIASLFSLVFTACDPMEDVYEEVDKANADKLEEERFFSDKTLIENGYELTDADYALSSDEGVQNYKNFSKYAPVADFLPEILDNMKLYGEAGVEYTVKYKFYRGSLSYIYDYLDYLEELAEMDSYTLTTADYDSMGTGDDEPGKYNNFSSSTPAEDYLPNFLLGKFPDAETGDELAVTYKYYDGGVSEITEFWAFDGSVWSESDKQAPEVPSDVTVYELTSSDYDSMGEESGQPGRYNNFSDSTPAENYLSTFLGQKFPYALDGAKYATIYKHYAGGGVTETRMKEYTLTDGEWVEYQSTIDATSLVAYKNRAWVFVPPIKMIESDKTATITYTLTDADYELVGNGRYSNFDIREGKDEESIEVRIEKITKILKANFEVAVGDVFAVTYDYYDGSNGSATITLEAVEDL